MPPAVTLPAIAASPKPTRAIFAGPIQEGHESRREILPISWLSKPTEPPRHWLG